MTPLYTPTATLAPRLTPLALALLLAFGPALAQQTSTDRANELRADLIAIESSMAVGLGHVSSDNRRFGQYRGLSDGGSFGRLELDLVRRDPETGTWLKLFGKNLGQDNRELRFTHERQGDWGYYLHGSQLSRVEPLRVYSGLVGGGTVNQVVSATAPKRFLDLREDHDILAFGARKFFGKGFDVQLSFKQDENNGERMFGRGTTNVQEFLTEPIDRITRQWQAQLGYADSKKQFTAGYSGSSYDNNVPVLKSTGGNAGSFGATWAIAMPLSNSAHQAYLSGGYNLGDSTRTSFKLSRTVALQNELFDPIFVRLPGSPDSLNGRVVTDLAYVDFSARPTSGMDLSATVRYEDRDDQTPEARFLTEAAATVGGSFNSAGFLGTYKPRSFHVFKGTLDAGFTLGGGYRLLAGLEAEELKRSIPLKYRRVGHRERSDETTARLELKRSMSETLNGSMALVHSDRGGSDYTPDTYDPNAKTNAVNALIWADRARNKLRLTADWVPDEAWSLQLLGDVSHDAYSGRSMGPREGRSAFLGADLTFKINDKWDLTAWASQEHSSSYQITRSDPTGTPAQGFNTTWDADLRYTTSALGLGLRGKPTGSLTVGADISGSNDKVSHNLSKLAGTGTLAVNSLPVYFYRQTVAKLFADHALQPKASIRVDLTLDRRSTNDWTWTNYTYNGAPAVALAARTSDGTTVSNKPVERVAVLGFSYHLRFR